MNLDEYVLKTMFEKSLFSDLSLSFYHESFPFKMRFDVHKAVVAQSPFFRLLLENTHRLATVDADSMDSSVDSQQTCISSPPPCSHNNNNGTLYLTIDLIQAMTRRGFIMTPSQHIIRRQWQRQSAALNETPSLLPSSSSTSERNNSDGSSQTRHILSSHLRFALKWMYSMDRNSIVDTLQDEDTLRVLCVAVLFDLGPLVDDCLERYTTHQLSMDGITDDLETICQLPRDHKAYHQLRDTVLLLLLRLGPQHPRHLARLPVDYMSDILSVDLLYIGSEYERYCLLREVLVGYMQSVGKITWTANGPVDQNFKRLSGFVQNLSSHQQQQQMQHNLSASDVRSSKRKRIPSEELDCINRSNKHASGESSSSSDGDGGDRGSRQEAEYGTSTTKHRRLARLSFSACVPFEKLVADASSGGVIDKATILSYLLRTTVNYSNMSFEQLAIVRQDGIVDESIVFRALWQREELERLLFPFNYQQSQQAPATDDTTQPTIIPRFGKMGSNSSSNDSSRGGGGAKDAMDRRAALDEYFDVGDADADGKSKRRRMLLGTPRFRFCASISVVLPWGLDDGNDDDDSWDLVELPHSSVDSASAPATYEMATANDQSDVFDDDNDDDNDSIWVCEDDRDTIEEKHTTTQKRTQHTLDQLSIGDTTEHSEAGNEGKQPQPQQQQPPTPQYGYKRTVYSPAKYILGHWHRVRVELKLIPRSSLPDQAQHNNNSRRLDDNKKRDEKDDVLVCRFELQRDYSAISSSSQQLSNNNNSNSNNKSNNNKTSSNALPHDNISQRLTKHPATQRSSPQQTKLRYDIYCLNRHQVLGGNDHVDPEDKVLVPVSKVTESNDANERSTSYVKQVVLNLDSLEPQSLELDMVIALEFFGFQKL